MTTFDQRKDAYENKFAHDEELRFKAEARRNKLVGLWAAEKLGMSGDAASDYAKAVVVADLAAPGQGDVLSKVTGDLAAKGIAVPDQEIRSLMGSLMVVAEAQVRQGV